MDDSKTVKLSKSKWFSLKNIALQREKTLQEILDEAISFYLKKEK
jgi:hypothetical protein